MNVKLRVEELHNQGLCVDEIVSKLELPYDINNIVSPINQGLKLSYDESKIIAQLRQWKYEESLPADIREKFLILKAEYMVYAETLVPCAVNRI
ncbi:hypothetical protein [Butyrivibrio sp. VCD2006]|uniref:hypothetical protein n=1 Tax=Butyrivibrio sp. VCD2006 TaxID=1280664 RepID=UPI00047975C7|nr:hypothetical protein [Butyrivibrio sp. VCD2006]